LPQLVRKDQDLSAENQRLDKNLVAAFSKPPNQRESFWVQARSSPPRLRSSSGLTISSAIAWTSHRSRHSDSFRFGSLERLKQTSAERFYEVELLKPKTFAREAEQVVDV
jgi:hypothetical protein